MRKRVLVTGGCGFIGREVVKQLLEKNYQVLVIDDFSNSAPIKKDSIELIRLDLTKNNGLVEIFKKVDYCIHLAARVGGIKFMNFSPGKILHDNLLIDLNILEAVNLAKVKKIVYASTIIIYDNVKNMPYKEVPAADLPIPKSTYGFSKLVGERLLQTYNQVNGLNYVIARISNVYGINPNYVPKEKLHVIPDLISKIQKTEKQIELYGGGRQIRSFINVDDAANGLITMMEDPQADGKIFNLTSSERLRIANLAELIWKIMKKKGSPNIKSLPTLPADSINSIADVTKIKEILGWQAQISMKQALPEIVERYMNKLR